jgi:hypothetical protein
MPRFVLLYHECPAGYIRPSHWDLMFECGAVLRTWALRELPRDWASIVALTKEFAAECRDNAAIDQVNADRLADHRLDYLSYEGAVRGGRGSVTRVEQGTYAILNETADQWQVYVNGRLICGAITLMARPAILKDAGDWRLIFQAASSID